MDWRDVRLGLFVPLERQRARPRSQHVFQQQAIYRSVTADEAGISPHLALPDAAPGFVETVAAGRAGRSATGRALGCAVRQDLGDEPARQARAADRQRRAHVDRSQGARRHRRRSAMPCGRATFSSWCASAARCSRRSSARSRTKRIAVAGADRLVLTEHIAVMDLLALADALLLPDDDLALADRAQEPAVRPDRGRPVRARLEPHGHAARRPGRTPAGARGAPRRHRARRAAAVAVRLLRRRCSAPAAAADDSSRGSASRPTTRSTNSSISRSTTRARETPSLQGFVAWLRTASAEIKRDMEIARDEVRVMTVHGAKGLEAPIVILADTTTPPARPAPASAAAAGAAGGRSRAGHAGPAGVDAEQAGRHRADRGRARGDVDGAAEDEYRRLLYVAMTRAADRLVVCGAVRQNKRPEGCWYDLVADALKPHCHRGAGRRRRRHRAGAIARPRLRRSRRSPASDAATPAKRDLPDWLTPRCTCRAAGARAAVAVGGLRRRTAVRARAAGSRVERASGAGARRGRAPAAAVAAGHSDRARAPTPPGATSAQA